MTESNTNTFVPSRAEGLRRISSFLERAGKYYSENRNYDLGPQNRCNVSELSPYLRLRLITEKELVSAVLSQHTLSQATRFIEEVCWRTYWKGWLEHRRQVWNNYLQELTELQKEMEKNGNLYDCYQKAITGKTTIEPFDCWVQELITRGYLHNHARMWFASIWIFTLKLPWVLGADFFFKYLFDGDPATNTLSWRWVAGLHTKGKSYIAKAENINRFTRGRFNPRYQLNEQAQLLPFTCELTQKELSLEKCAASLQNSNNVVLLISEENLTPEYWSVPKSYVKGIVAFPPNKNNPNISEKVFLFRKAAIEETLLRAEKFFSCPTQYLYAPPEEDLFAFCKNLNVTEVLTAYVPIGPTRERMNRLKSTLHSSKIELREIQIDWDQTFWPYTAGGYFKLKERIPNLLEQLSINQKDSNS